MSHWYNPVDWGRWGKKKIFGTGELTDAEAARKKQLEDQAAKASGLADYGQQSYQQLGADARSRMDYLRNVASGGQSIAGEQLRQGTQALQSQQRSMAAAAAPRDAGAAAHAAMLNSARLGFGVSGQAAMAGLQERRDAEAALANLINAQRAQDLQATLGGRGQAMQGYNQQYQTDGGFIGKYGGAVLAGVGAYYGGPAGARAGAAAGQALNGGGGGLSHEDPNGANNSNGSFGSSPEQLYSDRRLKTAIVPADDQARAKLEALQAYAYRYKDPATDGRGPQLGVMAQDLERAGLGQAVVNTASGKAVDTAKLTGANTAMLAALGKRVSELEGAGGGNGYRWWSRR